MTSEHIRIRGARQHNLKNIDVEIPRNALTVVTGVSGSGKSTLAFDILYAEGQRRYVESLSTYARQFLERLQKPEVDLIEGLSPAIAIEQKSGGHNPRSTVGTVTEIHDYLRLLYARVGSAHCPGCGRPIAARTIDEMVAQVEALPEGTRMLLLAPVAAGETGTHEKLLRRLKRDGFSRLRVDGAMADVEELRPLNPRRAHDIEVVVDRLVARPNLRQRLTDSLELALALGEGVARIEATGHEALVFSEQAACAACGTRAGELTPAVFSFNSPQGACPKCEGLGVATEFSPRLVVPDPNLCLRDGAVAVWARRSSVHFMEFLEALTAHYGASITTPFRELPERFQQVLLHGSGDEPITYYFDRGTSRIRFHRPFEGIIPNLRRRYRQTDSAQTREEIRRFMDVQPCPACGGTRLNALGRAVTIDGLNIAALCALTVADALRFCRGLRLQGARERIARDILKEIEERLGFLDAVGLSYLTLDRSAQSLAGGESQRIRLATQIGSRLTGVLYVLDEPSIGLHPRDSERLLNMLRRLRDLGNTLLVVEHDETAIRAADHVLELGPGAGARGGRVVFVGPPERMLACPDSLTGSYLCGRRRIGEPARRRVGSGPKLVLEGATTHNLRNITVEFPLERLVCVTGVSGSGKSSLVTETLYPALQRALNGRPAPMQTCRGLRGVDHIDRVLNIDQTPIGQSPRSNPGTYTGCFGFIRDLFARTPEARARGYKASRFSFNVKGGRCEACRGDGTLRIEMHFLPDVFVTCDGCRGRRYNRETLEVTYRGKTIAEVLGLTVDQGIELFGRIGAIREKLQALADVGLGYLQLGQPANTLSGGEAQRVKLSRELAKRSAGRTLFVLDEPTTGLHAEDIRRLMQVLNQLIEAGHSVVLIEHHLDVIRLADHVIDLGPEGGRQGGAVVGCGPPEHIAALPGSHTGRYLKAVLSR
ncbi:MAG: excinuclease ABC subunit UvrA [Desulfobacterales bacterium]|jgi:excinuclease ABC subunit A|nr:excinuclease ABC subunit UvrA [Desulfobacterales bacterium]